MEKHGRVECPDCGSGAVHVANVKQSNQQGIAQSVEERASCQDCGNNWKC